jgi:hypothetical protein
LTLINFPPHDVLPVSAAFAKALAMPRIQMQLLVRQVAAPESLFQPEFPDCPEQVIEARLFPLLPGVTHPAVLACVALPAPGKPDFSLTKIVSVNAGGRDESIPAPPSPLRACATAAHAYAA